MRGNLHFVTAMGRRPAGIGNEIFGLAKAIIGCSVLGGQISTPNYSNSMHEYPKVILDRFGSSKINFLSKRIKFGDELFLQFGNQDNLWDYRSLLEEFMSSNNLIIEGNHNFLHASKMTGGYLSIRNLRNFFLELFEITIPDSKASSYSATMHLRGPDTKDAFAWKSFVYSIDHFFKPALMDLSKSGTNFTELNLITNISSKNPIILELRSFADSLGFLCKIKSGNTLEHLKTLANSSFIIPSASTFSLLGIFLSTAKYLWPQANSTKEGDWFSIWGSEELQRCGPTSWFREQNISNNYDALNSRGMIYGSIQPSFLHEWISFMPKYQLSQDLIYYGSVKLDKEFLL